MAPGLPAAPMTGRVVGSRSPCRPRLRPEARSALGRHFPPNSLLLVVAALWARVIAGVGWLVLVVNGAASHLGGRRPGIACGGGGRDPSGRRHRGVVGGGRTAPGPMGGQPWGIRGRRRRSAARPRSCCPVGDDGFVSPRGVSREGVIPVGRRHMHRDRRRWGADVVQGFAHLPNSPTPPLEARTMEYRSERSGAVGSPGGLWPEVDHS